MDWRGFLVHNHLESPFRSPVAAALTCMGEQCWGARSKGSSSWSSGEDVQGKRTMCRPGLRLLPGWGAGKASVPPTRCLQRSQGSCCIASKTAEEGNN